MVLHKRSLPSPVVGRIVCLCTGIFSISFDGYFPINVSLVLHMALSFYFVVGPFFKSLNLL